MSEIENFVQRIEKANKARSRDIRISMSEALSLVNEMVLLLKRENQLLEKLTNIQQEQNNNQKELINPNEIVMDGGNFKS